jgi:hypothetical protein
LAQRLLLFEQRHLLPVQCRLLERASSQTVVHHQQGQQSASQDRGDEQQVGQGTQGAMG